MAKTRLPLFARLLFHLSCAQSFKVSVDTSRVLRTVDKKFLSIAIESHVVAERWKNFDFHDPGVKAMASALAPAYMRLGGTAADLLIFRPDADISNASLIPSWPGKKRGDPACWSATDQQGRGVCEKLNEFYKRPRSNFTMNGCDWDLLRNFTSGAGLDLLFDGNSVLTKPNSHKWDPGNFRQVLKYAARVGGKGLAFELGNEPNSLKNHLNVTLPATRLARSFKKVKGMLASSPAFSSSPLVGPDVNAIRKCTSRRLRTKKGRKKPCKALRYLAKFMRSGGGSVVDAVTWHYYYLNGHVATLKDFLSIEHLTAFRRNCRLVRGLLKRKGFASKPIWLGEAGSAYGGGARGISDR